MGEVYKPIIVVSAINIFEGGPLTILCECLRSLETNFNREYQIVALVHKKELFSNFNEVTFYEFPKSRVSWLFRIYYEYVHFKKISASLKPYLWLSLHDTSPILLNVVKQCVYCHNPSIFYKTSFSEFKYDKKHVLFSLLYRFLYRINIRSNKFIIVQQNWIRNHFSKLYGFPKSNIIVAYPGNRQPVSLAVAPVVKIENAPITFIYAAFPRIFKNYEVIVNAVKILLSQNITDFQVKFTLSGSENAYAAKVKDLSGNINQIKFLGILPHQQVMDEYRQSDVLIFPSKLETWGLPLTEFKGLAKPILAAELEYAHETVGNYDKISFFDPNDPRELAEKMKLVIQDRGEEVWQTAVQEKPASPFTESWESMINYILKNE